MFDSGSRETSASNAPGYADVTCSAENTGITLARVRFTELVGLLGFTLPVDASLAQVVFPVRRIKAGETLCHAGDPFNAVYVVRSGFFKTVATETNGAELVLGFPMPGEVIGLDGVDSGRYLAEVIALDICNVAVIPFAQLTQLAHQYPCVEKLLYSLFSRELVHKNAMAWVLGTLSAEARLASFLLDLSHRYGRLGYSRTSFALRATREEIGSYLGLKLETVSRTLSAFAAAGLIDVNRRQITLRDPAALRRVVDPNMEDEVATPHQRKSAPVATRRPRTLTEAALAMAA